MSKLSQFGPNISKIKVSTFWIPEIRSFPAGGQCQASRPPSFNQFSPNNGPPNPNKSNKCGFLAPLRLVTLVFGFCLTCSHSWEVTVACILRILGMSAVALTGPARRLGKRAAAGLGAPMQLPSCRGGCGSSRLDHGLKV